MRKKAFDRNAQYIFVTSNRFATVAGFMEHVSQKITHSSLFSLILLNNVLFGIDERERRKKNTANQQLIDGKFFDGITSVDNILKS